jgi:hypothetical protein
MQIVDPEIERSREIARRYQTFLRELERQDVELERSGIRNGRASGFIDIPAELEQAFDRAVEDELAAQVAPSRASTSNWIRG